MNSRALTTYLRASLAVKAQTHESPGPQSRQQGSPSYEGVSQMMQHSNCCDDVKRARNVSELENVGLCILNVRDAKLLRLSYGIADAAQAEVYRQYTNAAESLGSKIE